MPALNELDSEDDQTEAAALLAFEARNQGDGGDAFTGVGAPQLSSTLLPKWFIPSYEVELGHHIATGSFGPVYEGKWLGADVAVKFIMTDQRNDENRKQFLREVDLWFSLSDKHLIRLYGACHVGQPFFVCERAIKGTLQKVLQTEKSLRRKWRYIHEAALGLQHLHDHGIIHGDLKGNNILVGDDGTAKLCDFRFASLASSSPKQLTDTEIDALGAVRWKAPECLLGSGPTFASDIYSFGMCIIELLTGQYPWGATLPDVAVNG
ncbi:hypothetical protein V7S43_014515 [Phytophthora oleae]|uniref:Protein kinase domain-containing protein n=1 Tax=Phytophthora oleae TaxID=2107226 RepID=A0ABD3F1S2_9STRA